MSRLQRTVGFLAGVYLAVGLAFGTVGLASMSWAQAQFVTAAGGSSPGQFGPVMLAVVYFQTTVVYLLAGPLVGGAAGAMAGSQFRSREQAAVACAGGSVLGFLLMATLAVGLTSLVGGPGTGQLYSLGTVVLPVVIAAVASAVAGGVGGVAGSMATN